MKHLFLFLFVAGLFVAACAAPPVAPPAGEPAAQPSLPEVTVFRSPT